MSKTKGVRNVKITVIQPPYFAGDKPDEFIADFLIGGSNEKNRIY